MVDEVKKTAHFEVKFLESIRTNEAKESEIIKKDTKIQSLN